MTEDKMVGCHHQLDGHEQFWELVVDREARHAAVMGLQKELDVTEGLN